MRIDPTKIDGIYEAQLKRGAGQVHTDSIGSEIKEDRIELSKNAKEHDELRGLVSGIAGEIEKGASPDKLRALKKSISEGSYSVSSEEIAGAILNTK